MSTRPDLTSTRCAAPRPTAFTAGWSISRPRRARSPPRRRLSVPTATTRPSRPAEISRAAYTRTGTASATSGRLRTEAAASRETRFRRQLLGHEDARGAGRLARDAAEFAIAVLLVEAGSLEADGVEHGAAAAALTRLGLRELEDSAAEPAAAERGRQEHQIDEQQADRGAAQETPPHFAPLRVREPDRQA